MSVNGIVHFVLTVYADSQLVEEIDDELREAVDARADLSRRRHSSGKQDSVTRRRLWNGGKQAFGI